MQKLKLILVAALLCVPMFTLSAFSHVLPPERELNPALISSLVQSTKQPRWIVRRIVRQAVIEGNPKKFPTPYDILAVAKIESDFNPEALSKSGAIGVMQTLPKYWGTKPLGNASESVKLGSRILREYHSQFKTTNGALLAYNKGPGNAIKLCKPGVKTKTCKSDYSVRFYSARAEISNIPLFNGA